MSLRRLSNVIFFKDSVVFTDRGFLTDSIGVAGSMAVVRDHFTFLW